MLAIYIEHRLPAYDEQSAWHSKNRHIGPPGFHSINVRLTRLMDVPWQIGPYSHCRCKAHACVVPCPFGQRYRGQKHGSG